MTTNRVADRLDIADTIHRYAEAIDIIGAHPLRPGEPNPALARAVEVLRTCLADEGIVPAVLPRPRHRRCAGRTGRTRRVHGHGPAQAGASAG